MGETESEMRKRKKSTAQSERTILYGNTLPDGLLLCNPSPTPSVLGCLSKGQPEERQDSDEEPSTRSPSSTVEWVEAASSNLKIKAKVAEKVFETAEKLAEVAETRTRELNTLEEAYKRVSKELECYKLFEVKLRQEGIMEEKTIREIKWFVVNTMKSQKRGQLINDDNL